MRKPLKQLIAALLAFVLVLLMGRTVLAASGSAIAAQVQPGSFANSTQTPHPSTPDAEDTDAADGLAAKEPLPAEENTGADTAEELPASQPEQQETEEQATGGPAAGETPEATTDNNAPEDTTAPGPEATEDATSDAASPGASAIDADTAALAAIGLAPDGASPLVASYEALKQALEADNGHTTIYLGADIAADTSGIIIHPSKPFVIIDGSPTAGERYRFTQSQSADANRLIRVEGSSQTAQVTLRNMDITGKNTYGIVWMAAALGNVTLSLENVHYTGPQPVYHRGGTARFVGGSYTLAGGELAEAMHVELGGELTIDAPGTSNAILWLVSTASTFTVLPNANVTVSTSNYFIFGSIAQATLQPGASLSLTSGRFGFSYAGDTVATFIIAEHASLYINLHTTESYAALRVSKLFQMQPGSSATILRTGTAGIPLRLTAAGAQATFNQPQRVFFFSSAGVPLRFTGAGSLSIITSAVNIWSKTIWPLAGGTNVPPTHMWNKAGNTLLTITGTYNEAANRGLTHNLLPDDPATAPLDASSFDLEHSQLLAFGAHVLDIDPATSTSPALTGGTGPMAELAAAYILADGQGGTIGGTSDALGRYRLPVAGGALLAGSAVTVLSRVNDLFIRQVGTVLDANTHKLSFLSVPQAISFGSPAVPGAQSLVGRQQPGFAITASDTRPSPGQWRIDASLAHPLTATVNGLQHQLPNAIVYRVGNTTTPLNDKSMTVYSQSTGANGSFAVSWGSDEGILLHLAPGQVYSQVEYSTTIHWTLVDAP